MQKSLFRSSCQTLESISFYPRRSAVVEYSPGASLPWGPIVPPRQWTDCWDSYLCSQTSPQITLPPPPSSRESEGRWDVEAGFNPPEWCTHTSRYHRSTELLLHANAGKSPFPVFQRVSFYASFIPAEKLLLVGFLAVTFYWSHWFCVQFRWTCCGFKMPPISFNADANVDILIKCWRHDRSCCLFRFEIDSYGY